MKKAKTPPPAQDDMRPEYDFAAGPSVRGKHAAAMRQGYSRIVHHADGTREITEFRSLEGSIVLDPDVQAYFPDAEAVNTALRGLIALRPRRRRASAEGQVIGAGVRPLFGGHAFRRVERPPTARPSAPTGASRPGMSADAQAPEPASQREEPMDEEKSYAT